jgi:sugar phosphate isomerase/epimerase
MNNPVIMHINYAEQGQTIPQICDLARRCGYDGVEFRRTVRAYEGKPQAYIDAIAAEADRCGLRHVLFGSMVDLMSADVEKRKREVDEAVKFCRLAVKRFKFTVMNTFSGPLQDRNIDYAQFDKQGSVLAKPEHWEWAAEGFKTIGACAKECGFRLAFETHMAYLHDLPAAACRLVEMIGSPAVGINLDYANLAAFPNPVSMQDAFVVFGNKIFYAHVKNFMKVDGLRYGGLIRCGLGDGSVNNRELLRLLKAEGYAGPIAIEAPRPGDREWFAKQDIAYMRALLAEIE